MNGRARAAIGGGRIGAAAAGLAIALASAGPARGDDPAGVAFFEAKIRPVLIEHCYACHSPEAPRPKGGLRLDTRDGIRRGGSLGPAVVPGEPDESPIVWAIAHGDEASPMPPSGKLPEAAIADVRRWIELGAPDPREEGGASAEPTADPLDWWSLRPIGRPEVPAAVGPSRNPIDAFLNDALRDAGLEPGPEADRRTLLRRLAFDLTGLPPTFEEVEAFVNDDRPDAYDRLVDRLLASPHFGERQARFWMDLVHFAETHGHDQDRVREHAWPYRDYLIRSFNGDTPYGRFVEEQVAADVLYPDDPGLVAALGFLAAGPWDESSLRDIREDSIDRQVGHYLDRDDVVTTVMSTFASTTVHCARCHDHKFDPIGQGEYYALQAVFAGVDRADRAFDPDPAVAGERAELAGLLRAIRGRDPSLLGPGADAEVAAWEARIASPPAWEVLDPDRFKSSGGASLAKQEDGSILAGGEKAAQDTYTIRARTGLRRITGLRLEVLPDDRLPNRGPGRNANGNLHLTEIRILAAPGDRPDGAEAVRIAFASSDFDQEGWGVAAAIDGDASTAWGIHPEVGKPHEAVFELAEDIGYEGGTALTVELQQTSPADHPIGRFRLSATSADRPVRASGLPGPIAAIAALPRGERTEAQRAELAFHVLAESAEARLAALPPPRYVYAAASEYEPDGSHRPPGGPRPVHVLRRGDIRNPGPLAEPGALACVAALPSRFALEDPTDEGARRAALARWLSHPDNPLTWRSIVNRAWQQHFGRGLVDSPNDFGRMGSEPSHPELLDWLAGTFRDGGGSLKDLHRLIVTSAAYRRSSEYDPGAAAVDAGNRLRWRQDRRRLDADAIRDAMLAASGALDRTLGGPSVRHFVLRPGVHVTPVVEYGAYDEEGEGSGRRSVYRFVFRTLPDPFFDVLDAADASQLTPARGESITALQALALQHNRFVLRQSERFARRLEGASATLDGRIDAAFRLALGRGPTFEERDDWAAYAAEHGLENACRMLFNCNEFLYVD